MGYTMATHGGAYAEYAVGNASHVVRVPDGVTSFDAAPLMCAGVTTYKALKVAHPRPGETAMFVGIGGMGHLGLQYAKISGTTTVAVDVDDAKLQLATRVQIPAGKPNWTSDQRFLRCQSSCGFDHRLDALDGAPAVARNQRAGDIGGEG